VLIIKSEVPHTKPSSVMVVVTQKLHSQSMVVALAGVKCPNWTQTTSDLSCNTFMKQKKCIDECYFDNMQEIIDNFIEKIPEYVF
jgi:hypothetical protein